MIIYFGTLFIIWLYGTFGNVNSSKIKKRHFLIFSFGLMILVMSLRKYTVGRDLNGHYAESYLTIGSMKSFEDAINYGQLKGYGLGYSVYNKILSMINPDIQFFLTVTAFITIAVMGVIIYLYSNDVALSTFLFISNCTYYIYFSMIRQSLAISIILIGFILFNSIKKTPWNYLAFIALIILASTFHSSAILTLVLILFLKLKFRRKEILIVLVFGAAVFLFYDNFYSLLISRFVNDSHYEIYLGVSSDSFGAVNIESMIFFTLSLFPFVLGYYFIIWNRRKKRENLSQKDIKIEKNENFLLFTSASYMICKLLVFRMNIFGRFSYYFIPFIYLLYPYILEVVEKKSNYYFLKRCFYIVFTLYFIYMTFFNAKLYYGVLPYEFFWQ